MCGIVGYTGDQQAAPILLAGLERRRTCTGGCKGEGTSARAGRENRQWTRNAGQLRYRSYPLGDTRGAV